MPYFGTEDGTELFFSDWGEGRPVVLIHGWPLSSAMWEFQARTLAENGFRVITYDRRGFGRSDQPFEGYDYDTMTEDLAELVEELDLQDAALVGFSMGGGEVARYLARFGSERVSRAVFISAVTPFLLKTEDNPEGIDQSVFEGIAEKIEKDRLDFHQDFAHSFYGRTLVNHTVSQALLDWDFNMASAASPRAVLECATSWCSTDFRDDLTKIDIPTLVIHGTSDATVPIQVSGRRTAQIVPNAELIEYDGEPHGLWATAAERLNKDLIAFLSR